MRIVVGKPFAAVAACGAVLLAVQGCTSGPSNPPARSPAHAGKPLPLNHALTLAQIRGSHETSMRANINVQVTTVTKRGTTHSTTTGTVQAQRTPAPISDSNLVIVSAGHRVPMEEIETGSTIYLKLASLAGNTGKPWVAVNAAGAAPGLGTGTGVNPLSSQHFLSVSKNLHEVGTAVVNGVSTTEYDGSYPISALLAGLPAKAKRKLAGKIKGAGPAQLSVWLSSNGQLQKLMTTEAIPPQTITTTIDITAVNVPIHIAIPPASQVARIPANALGGL
jgi:hypothetical protein